VQALSAEWLRAAPQRSSQSLWPTVHHGPVTNEPIVFKPVLASKIAAPSSRLFKGNA
jgi:hypothetical protein